MPTWVKVVLVVVVTGFVLLVAGIFVVARWVRAKGEVMQEQGRTLVADAEKFGAGQPGEACVTESLARLTACDGFICEAKVKVFLTTCLTVANDSPELCTDVPLTSDFMASARWQLEECRRRGSLNDQRCTRMISSIQIYCEGR